MKIITVLKLTVPPRRSIFGPRRSEFCGRRPPRLATLFNQLQDQPHHLTGKLIYLLKVSIICNTQLCN